MKRGVAIAIGASAILHLSVLAALDRVEPRRRPRAPAGVQLTWAEPPTPTVVPIDVSMVTLPPPAAELPPPGATPPPTAARPDRPPVGPVPPTRASAAADPGAAIAATTPGTAIGAEAAAGSDPGAGGEPAPGTGRLSMRRPGTTVSLDPRYQQLRVIDDPDAPPPWTPPTPTGELRPSGGGTHRTPRPGYTAAVGVDGDISFADQEAFEAHLALPNPRKVAGRAARAVEDWFRDPGRQVREQEVDRSTCHRGGGNGVDNCLVASDYGGGRVDTLGNVIEHGKVVEHDGNESDTVTIPVVGGRTEITDYVMRKLGQDPYQADKLRWMDATRDERIEIARVHRARELGRADQIVRRHLDRLWARTDLDVAAKRAALFELWDDGAEDGEPAVVEAAARARAQVIGFIRAHLPAGSGAAYTAAELEQLNRRRTSTARFAPYE